MGRPTRRLTSRRLLVAVLVLSVASLVLGVATPPRTVPIAEVESFSALPERVSGADRIATAVAVAEATFPAGATTVILARDDTFPDALAAAPLAGAMGGPILVTPTATLDPRVGDAIRRLGAAHVVVLGGEAALSGTVVRELEGAVTVERVAGPDRASTAAAVARRTEREGIGDLDGVRSAILATGEGFADALAASPLAHARRLPILLTSRDHVSGSTVDALDELSIAHVVVVGGSAVISEAVIRTLTAGGVTVSRIAGATRTETAVRLADRFANAVGLRGATLVRSDDFPDALAAAPLSSSRTMPLLLASAPTDLGDDAAIWLADNCVSVSGLLAVGGESAVAETTLAEAQAIVRDCGSTDTNGFPNADTTGVPKDLLDEDRGVNRLTPSGTITVTEDGAVVDAMDVTGCIFVQANDVTIRRTRVRGDCFIDAGRGDHHGTLVEDVEIDGMDQNAFQAGIGAANFICRRCHIHNVGHGVNMSHNVVIEHSYIHDMAYEYPSHNDAVLSNGGSGFLLRYNNLEIQDIPGASASVALYGDFSPIHDVLIEGNLINGGGYCTYAGSLPEKPYPIGTYIRYIDNHFGRKFHPGCGYYGVRAGWNGDAPGNVWSGNVWHDTGEPVF